MVQLYGWNGIVERTIAKLLHERKEKRKKKKHRASAVTTHTTNNRNAVLAVKSFVSTNTHTHYCCIRIEGKQETNRIKEQKKKEEKNNAKRATKKIESSSGNKHTERTDLNNKILILQSFRFFFRSDTRKVNIQVFFFFHFHFIFILVALI